MYTVCDSPLRCEGVGGGRGVSPAFLSSMPRSPFVYTLFAGCSPCVLVAFGMRQLSISAHHPVSLCNLWSNSASMLLLSAVSFLTSTRSVSMPAIFAANASALCCTAGGTPSPSANRQTPRQTRSVCFSVSTLCFALFSARISLTLCDTFGC